MRQARPSLVQDGQATHTFVLVVVAVARRKLQVPETEAEMRDLLQSVGWLALLSSHTSCLFILEPEFIPRVTRSSLAGHPAVPAAGGIQPFSCHSHLPGDCCCQVRRPDTCSLLLSPHCLHHLLSQGQLRSGSYFSRECSSWNYQHLLRSTFHYTIHQQIFNIHTIYFSHKSQNMIPNKIYYSVFYQLSQINRILTWSNTY